LPSDFRAKKQKKRVKNPPHLLPPLFVFPNGAAINVGFDDNGEVERFAGSLLAQQLETAPMTATGFACPSSQENRKDRLARRGRGGEAGTEGIKPRMPRIAQMGTAFIQTD
jgi:hypothetical protein